MSERHLYLGTLPNGRVDLIGDFEQGPAKLVYHFESPGSNRRTIAKVERQEDGSFRCGEFTAATVQEAGKLFWDDLERRHEDNVSARELRRRQRHHEENPCTEMEEARAMTARMKRENSSPPGLSPSPEE